MKSYYLSPKSWDSSSYRDIYDEEDIKNLPADWNADASDCDYIGDFPSRREAIAEAKTNPEYKNNMR